MKDYSIAIKELRESKIEAVMIGGNEMMQMYLELIDVAISELDDGSGNRAMIFVEEARQVLRHLKQEAITRMDQNFITLIEERIEPHLKCAERAITWQ